jgi:cytochrome d ubiquinol oxidase subunit I
VVTFPHVVFAAYMTAGTFVLGVSAYLYMKKRHEADRPMYHHAIRIGAVVTLRAGIGDGITGDLQGKVMTEVQPMKMAAAEGLYETSEGCAPFSILTIGTPDGEHEKFAITVPCLLSFLGTGSFDGTVQGINPLKEEYAETYGTLDGADPAQRAGDYVPIIPVTYWSFRFMMGLGFFAAGGAALILWLTRKGRTPGVRWLGVLGLSLPIATTLASSWGWIFTEMGRQPWVVFGLMTTESGVSPGVSVFEAATSLVVLTALYAVLAVVEVKLLVTYVRKGAEPYEEPPRVQVGGSDEDKPLTFAY